MTEPDCARYNFVAGVWTLLTESIDVLHVLLVFVTGRRQSSRSWTVWYQHTATLSAATPAESQQNHIARHDSSRQRRCNAVMCTSSNRHVLIHQGLPRLHKTSKVAVCSAVTQSGLGEYRIESIQQMWPKTPIGSLAKCFSSLHPVQLRYKSKAEGTA